MNVDFIFDFASPNAYLCHKAIIQLEKKHDIMCSRTISHCGDGSKGFEVSFLTM